MALTYLNKDEKPIIRQCGNCKSFEIIPGTDRVGYCKLKPMTFAYTGKQTVYAMVRTYYYCDDQEFINEEYLKLNNVQVDMKYFPKMSNGKDADSASG